MRRVSRREFLKFLGASGIALAVSGLAFRSLSDPKRKGADSVRTAVAQSAGTWIQGPNTTCVAIHAALLHNGNIFYMAGSGYHRDRPLGPFEARLLLDPDSGTELDVPMFEDLWCAGHTHLSNGNLLIAGGTLMYDTNPNNCNGEWHGLKSAYEFDVTTGLLIPVQSMAAGRWYPTLVTLADGSVLNYEGFDEYGSENRLVEIYDESTKTWSIKYDSALSTEYCIGEESGCPGAGTMCFGGTPGHGVGPRIGTYPRMHLLANGLIVIAGMHLAARSYDTTTGSFTILPQMNIYRHYGSSVLLPLQNTLAEKGKVLAVGGSSTSSGPATYDAEILDFNAGSPAYRTVQPLQYARKFTLPVILPDGKVVLFGGSSQGVTNYVNYPEMFDPVTETWTQLPAEPVPRSYHAVAILLPDGRVWVAGSTPASDIWEPRTEFFSPWYFAETRPTILGPPTVGDYGGNITIATPNAADITSVSLVRLMSSTHHFEPNQRFLWLQILSTTPDSVIAAAPLNGNLAPPGYYMIHVLNSSGVPSVAKIIKIPGVGGGDTIPPTQVTGLTVTPAGSSQLDLAWNANPEPDFDHYNVHRSTTSGFTPSPANRIAQPSTASYQDTGLSSSTTYYYLVTAVDASTNIGPASSEASGTTTGEAPAFYDVAFPGNSVGPLYNGSSTRYGEEARIALSVIVGKSLKIWKVYLRRIGSASGNITAAVRRSSDDVVVAAFNETIDASSLPTSFVERTFTLTSAHVIQAGDRILIEYNGPNRIEISLWTTDQIDGINTRRTRYDGSSYIGGNAVDIVGSMSSNAGGGDTIPPTQVTGLTVTPAGSSQLDLAWNANPEPDFDHYNVHRSTTSGFTPSPANRIAQPSTASYQDTGLSSSTTYYYLVTAVDASTNIGPASSEASGTTTGSGGVFYDVPGPAGSQAALWSGSNTRYGEEARIASSMIVGQSLKRWKVYLRQVISPSGTVTAVIRNSADAVVATFNESLNAASLPTSFVPFDFTLSSPYVIQTGDKVLIEYSGSSRIEISQANTDQFDGNATQRTRYTPGGGYVGGNTQDIAGTMSSV